MFSLLYSCKCTLLPCFVSKPKIINNEGICLFKNDFEYGLKTYGARKLMRGDLVRRDRHF